MSFSDLLFSITSSPPSPLSSSITSFLLHHLFPPPSPLSSPFCPSLLFSLCFEQAQKRIYKISDAGWHQALTQRGRWTGQVRPTYSIPSSFSCCRWNFLLLLVPLSVACPAPPASSRCLPFLRSSPTVVVLCLLLPSAPALP
eukprot:764588-Hanusia_phi.AAC.3